MQSSGDDGGAAKFDIFADMSNYDTGDDDEKRPRCHITALLFVQIWYNQSAEERAAMLIAARRTEGKNGDAEDDKEW